GQRARPSDATAHSGDGALARTRGRPYCAADTPAAVSAVQGPLHHHASRTGQGCAQPERIPRRQTAPAPRGRDGEGEGADSGGPQGTGAGGRLTRNCGTRGPRNQGTRRIL